MLHIMGIALDLLAERWASWSWGMGQAWGVISLRGGGQRGKPFSIYPHRTLSANVSLPIGAGSCWGCGWKCMLFLAVGQVITTSCALIPASATCSFATLRFHELATGVNDGAVLAHALALSKLGYRDWADTFVA